MFFDAIYNGVILKAALFLSNLAAFVDRYVVDAVVLLVPLIIRLLSGLSGFIDENLVDGLVNGAGGGDVAGWTGEGSLAPQSCRVRIYLLLMVAALAMAGGVVFGVLMWRR